MPEAVGSGGRFASQRRSNEYTPSTNFHFADPDDSRAAGLTPTRRAPHYLGVQTLHSGGTSSCVIARTGGINWSV